MSSWCVLELTEQPEGQRIPQLLVKPAFRSNSYTVYLTCLTNIWSEELNFIDIVDRATEHQSPIEISKQDTAQLAILLQNVKNSLGSSEDTECRLTRDATDNITLHTKIRLPEPLDFLTWKFHLRKRTSVTLKNELILPLLVSSHIQYERINDLVTTIENKDKAIDRMVDQFESSNLDLAAAFPSIGGLKTGRKMIKREQAARHIPALRPFQHDVWRAETAQLIDSDVTSLGLFQEALVQCTPEVPLSLQADDGAEDWLSAVPNRLTYTKPAIKVMDRESALFIQPPKHGHESSLVDEDTEDEFEVHENFKTRNMPIKGISTLAPTKSSAQQLTGADVEDSTEDEDLDTSPHRQQGQTQSYASGQTRQHIKLPSPKEPSPPGTSPPSLSRSKNKDFCIGGRLKKETPETLQQEDAPAADEQDATLSSILPQPQKDSQASVSSKRPRKPFRIGGKHKNTAEASLSQHSVAVSPTNNRFRDAPSLTPRSSSLPLPKIEAEELPLEEARETPEEKAERKRAELKRHNEDIAKKQAQHKKKKRF